MTKSDAEYVLKNSRPKYTWFCPCVIEFPEKSMPDEGASDQMIDDDDGDVIELCNATKDFAEQHVALLLHKL